MQETDLHYPPERCPFCDIAAAFPFPAAPPAAESTAGPAGPPASGLWQHPRAKQELEEEAELARSIPTEQESDCEKTSPSSFVVLRSRYVVAFLDILPMTGGHLLVTTRNHKVKLADMEADESKEIGFYLPLLARTVSKVTSVSDYNIVQNNGARAAQVVPHLDYVWAGREGGLG
ncbi:hypothetical protein IAQ61_005840 [Plenodomus lingam]|uniref:uncharacterized protein n=1 Tax=Leptosphaeria maculans TaxID=5022 RepID=UPI003328E734|nr:hypothetical protein IAQ61_005840 [Plenodomus lingam]